MERSELIMLVERAERLFEQQRVSTRQERRLFLEKLRTEHLLGTNLNPQLARRIAELIKRIEESLL